MTELGASRGRSQVVAAVGSRWRCCGSRSGPLPSSGSASLLFGFFFGPAAIIGARFDEMEFLRMIPMKVRSMPHSAIHHHRQIDPSATEKIIRNNKNKKNHGRHTHTNDVRIKRFIWTTQQVPSSLSYPWNFPAGSLKNPYAFS